MMFKTFKTFKIKSIPIHTTVLLEHIYAILMLYVFAAEAGPGKEPNWAQMELRLIQSKKDIESPVIEYTATQK